MAKKKTAKRGSSAKKKTTKGNKGTKSAAAKSAKSKAAQARKSTKRSKPATARAASRTAPKKTPSAAAASRTTTQKKTASRSAATPARRGRAASKRPSRMASAGAAVRGGVAGAVAAVSRRLGGDSEPDAIRILEQDHRRLEELLRQGEETTERARTARQELLSTITSELEAHELMEEKVLYPALQSHPEARDIVLEGYEEHHVADLILAELREVATDDEQWGAKFKVLKENIEHHIEEEEGDMFRTARGLFSREELQGLGERMLALRKGSSASTPA